MSHLPNRARFNRRPSNRRNGPPVEHLEVRRLMATIQFDKFVPMNLQDDFNPPTPALNYPGFINVDPGAVTGPISELRVTLYGVYHERPEDMDILLVNPAGKSVILMSDAGGTFGIPGENAIDLTFTDTATRDLPELARIQPGLYRPTNYDQDDFFPGEAPFDAPSDDTLQALAADDPAGTWRIFVVDDTIGNIGGVGTGWGLTFVTGGTGPVAPSTPDLHPASDRGPSNSDNVTNVPAPVFRGTATAGTQVRLFVDGVANETGPITNGNWQIHLNAPLTDGVHAISARAIDAQGNEGAVSGDLMVTIDTEAPDTPSAPDLTPESDTGASNTDNDTTDTTPTFTGSAPGANVVTLVVNGVANATGTVTNDVFTVTSNTLAPGAYDFQVVSQDLAGNNSTQFPPSLHVVIRPGGTTTPHLQQVYARGSTWAPPDTNASNLTFMEYLEAQGLGDKTYGYKLTAGATLPWVNIDQIVMTYDSALSGAPPASNITVDGVRSDYAVTTSLLDSKTVVATLPRPLGNLPTGGDNGDRIHLTILGLAAGIDPFSLNFNVLQGDVDRSGTVVAQDFSEVKAKFFRSTNSPGSGASGYDVYHDVDASGQIVANDFSAVKARFFDNLPAAAASAGSAFSSTRIADDVLR